MDREAVRHCIECDLLSTDENVAFPAGEETAVVEPNSRPAGMRIWDLAGLVFDFDPWAAWLNYSRAGKSAPEFVEQRGYAGIRMISAPADGVLSSLPHLSGIEAEFPELKEVVLTKKLGALRLKTMLVSSDMSFAPRRHTKGPKRRYLPAPAISRVLWGSRPHESSHHRRCRRRRSDRSY